MKTSEVVVHLNKHSAHCFYVDVLSGFSGILRPSDYLESSEILSSAEQSALKNYGALRREFPQREFQGLCALSHNALFEFLNSKGKATKNVNILRTALDATQVRFEKKWNKNFKKLSKFKDSIEKNKEKTLEYFRVLYNFFGDSNFFDTMHIYISFGANDKYMCGTSAFLSKLSATTRGGFLFVGQKLPYTKSNVRDLQPIIWHEIIHDSFDKQIYKQLHRFLKNKEFASMREFSPAQDVSIFLNELLVCTLSHGFLASTFLGSSRTPIPSVDAILTMMKSGLARNTVYQIAHRCCEYDSQILYDMFKSFVRNNMGFSEKFVSQFTKAAALHCDALMRYFTNNTKTVRKFDNTPNAHNSTPGFCGANVHVEADDSVGDSPS